MGNQGPIALFVVAAVLFGSALASCAMVVRESSSPVVITLPDPLHAPYLGNVGSLPAEIPRSAVYIGKGFVLTTYHGYRGRSADHVQLLGRTHAFDAKKSVRLRNPAWTGLREACDLVLVRLTEPPDLPDLRLAARPPFGGERVILAGFGRVRDGGRTTLETLKGYQTRMPAASESAMAAWGENLVEIGGVSYRTQSPDGDVLAFVTVFDDGDALSLEAQAAAGDSGGAVFIERGSGWELAGIIEAVGPGHLAPALWVGSGNGAPFGAATYATDLTVYRDQILSPAAVPEPSAAVLLALGAACFGRRRRRCDAA